MSNPSEEMTRAHCNTCGGERNCFVRASYKKGNGDEESQWSDTFQVLECCGCEAVMVRHDHWFSEWDSYDTDSNTGLERRRPGIETKYYPPAIFRNIPKWIDKLADEALTRVFHEVYSALHNDSHVLALSGMRTLLDLAMTLKLGDVGGFAKKLTTMRESGFIGSQEYDLLSTVTDAGHAAIHRGLLPSHLYGHFRIADSTTLCPHL